MKTRYPECEEKTTAPIIKFEESKVKLYFLNPNRRESLKIKVDGCIYEEGSEEIRCDYLLLDFNHREHFIELKGSDVPHAIKQLEASINARSESPRDLLKSAYVAAINFHPKITTKVGNEKARFKRDFNATLKIVKSGHEETL